MLFEGLFWNCRDRLNERVYLARICNQEVFAAATGVSDPLTAGAVRVAFRGGQFEDVLAEVDAQASIPTPAQDCKVVRHELLVQAAMGVRLGRVTASENPGLIPALRLIAQNMKARMPEKSLTVGPSSAEAVAMSCDSITVTEQEEQSQMTFRHEQHVARQQTPA
jgi:hypothetical protein